MYLVSSVHFSFPQLVHRIIRVFKDKYAPLAAGTWTKILGMASCGGKKEDESSLFRHCYPRLFERHFRLDLYPRWKTNHKNKDLAICIGTTARALPGLGLRQHGPASNSIPTQHHLVCAFSGDLRPACFTPSIYLLSHPHLRRCACLDQRDESPWRSRHCHCCSSGSGCGDRPRKKNGETPERSRQCSSFSGRKTRVSQNKSANCGESRRCSRQVEDRYEERSLGTTREWQHCGRKIHKRSRSNACG